MADEQTGTVETDSRNVEYTVPLTEAAESGDISPNEYASRRANIVGENNIFDYIIIPLLIAFWRRFFRSARQTALIKSESD